MPSPAARRNCRTARARSRRASRTCSPRSLPADVVLVNPPRTGVHERVTAALQSATAAPRAIDLRELRSGDARARPRAHAALSHRVARALRHVSADGARRNRVRARAGGRMKYFVRIGDEDRGRARRRRRPASTAGRSPRVAPIRRHAGAHGDDRQRDPSRGRAPPAPRAAGIRCGWTASASRWRRSTSARAPSAISPHVAPGRPARRRSSRRCPGSIVRVQRASRATPCRPGRDSS